MKPLVVLVNPLVGDPYEFTRRNRPLPLGLLSVAGAIRDRCEVEIVDQRMTPKWPVKLASLLARRPAMVGLHVMGGSQIAPGIKLSRWIRRRTDAPLVWGGVFGALAPEIALTEPSVDIVTRGEGEAIAPALVDALVNKSPLEGVDGIAFRADGQTRMTQSPPLVDVDSLPELPYDLVDLKSYDWSAGINVREDVFKLQIELSRGCLSKCVFCYNPFFNRSTWRAQSAERSIERIARLVKNHGAGYLDMIDDSHFEDLARVRAIARGMIETGVNVPHLINGGKVEPLLEMTQEELGLLARAGCEVIHIGAESGSERVLDIIKKETTPDHIRQVNLKLARAGIIPSFYFLAGTPGETWDDLRRSTSLMMAILRENPSAKIISSFTFTPFLKTPGFSLAKKHGLVEPTTLRGWARFDTVRTAQSWLEPSLRRKISSLFFYTIWIDGKVLDLSPSRLVRAVVGIYRPVARWRLSTARLGFPIDVWVGKLGLGAHRTMIRVLRWLRIR